MNYMKLLDQLAPPNSEADTVFIEQAKDNGQNPVAFNTLTPEQYALIYSAIEIMATGEHVEQYGLQ